MTKVVHDKPGIGILDYGMGNLRSVYRAFLEVGASARIVQDPEEMAGLQALVFPGQGSIVDTMRLIRERKWDRFILDWIARDRPFFGICLGLQALFQFSEEGQTHGLGIFPDIVKRFNFPLASGIKIPHMGWNNVRISQTEDPLASGLSPDLDQFYFVHSYYLVPEDKSLIWGSTEYGELEFCSAIRRGNLIATQFHPEKSQSKGLLLYANFVRQLSGPVPPR